MRGDFLLIERYPLFMKFRLFIKYLIILLFTLNITQPVKADLASDLLKLAEDSNKKYKFELTKWGLKNSKDITPLKSKEIKLLIEGNILTGYYNDNQQKGPVRDTYYKDGTYESQEGREKGKWKVTQNKLCYNPGGCVKVYKSKNEPVYYLKMHGVLYTQFTKVISIVEAKAAEEKRIAKEKQQRKKD